MINTYKENINKLLAYYKEKQKLFSKIENERTNLYGTKPQDFVNLSPEERKEFNLKRATLYEQAQLARAQYLDADTAIKQNLKCLITTVGNMVLPHYIGNKIGEKTRQKIENEMRYYLPDINFRLFVDKKESELRFSISAFIIQGSITTINGTNKDKVFDIPEAIIKSPEFIEQSINETYMLKKEYYEEIKPKIEHILKEFKDKFPAAVKAGKVSFPNINIEA